MEVRGVMGCVQGGPCGRALARSELIEAGSSLFS